MEIKITSEQREELIRSAYKRGIKAGLLMGGAVALAIFIIMAHVVIYVGN